MRPPFRTCRDTGTCDKEAHISGWPLTRARAVAARTRLRTMPFKVVQTFEDGDLFITFCPDHWESNGKLLWPQSLFEGEKLKKKEDSQPQNDWQVLDCVVKRNNLTLAQAKAAAKAMSDLSETEEEDGESKAKKIKFCRETNTKCLNNLAEECLAEEGKEKQDRERKMCTTIQETKMRFCAKRASNESLTLHNN
ncbi:hypothetical protein MSG28_013604 [Choristoneura fumiferana]|uniref:Uncharacterized protein n=1 Tax=Choristoneura fumiferana TaxID=7141 RepID=A0ACC0K835_CHOFU|nr:hypothetical protein MSG28_013604 [Choristoneura fumiferana]